MAFHSSRRYHTKVKLFYYGERKLATQAGDLILISLRIALKILHLSIEH